MGIHQKMETIKDNLKQEDLEYLEKLNIQGVFQELVSKLIQVRPEGEENVRKFFVYEMKKMMLNNKAEYFNEEDFSLIFSTLNILNEETIPREYVFRALDIIDCKYDRETIFTRYKLEEEKTLTKKAFLKVLKREY